jgi:prepilin peptidase CpaA
MEHRFFPDPVFAWVFFAALVAVTGVAAVIDLRTLRIPKVLTLSLLGLGVVFSVVRMAWLGAVRPGFTVPDLDLYVSDAWTGAGLGLLYALAGVALGFGLFFVMWYLGACGGGDVKLFAALGAWGGVVLTVLLLIGTIGFVVVLAAGRFVLAAFGVGPGKAYKDYSIRGAAAHGQRAGGQGAGDFKRPKKRLTAYSLAVALSVVVVCLWWFRGELFAAPAGHGAAQGGPDAGRVARGLEK